MKSDIIRWLTRPVAMIGDALVLTGAFFLAYQARFEWEQLKAVFPVTKGTPLFSEYLPFLPATLVLWIFVLSYQKCYQQLNISLLDEFVRMMKAAGSASLLVMAATFLYHGADFSRLAMGLMGVFGAGLLFLWRETLKVARTAFIGTELRRILIVGQGRLAVALEKVLIQRKDYVFVKTQRLEIEKMIRLIEKERTQEVLIADPSVSHAEAVSLALACEEKGVECRIVPDILEIRMGEVFIDESLGIPTFKLKPITLRGGTFVGKRIFDCVVSTVILSILSIPLILIGFLTRLDSPGPFLFKQPRMGHKGKSFLFYKMRTMVVNADELLEALKAKNERGGPVFKMKDDPRVTRIGKFLRRYSLDEIPQLINVLRGDMSLVGPRPQVLWEAKAYDEWAKKRLHVLPGITGLWQVSGRADLTYEEMIDLDIYYLEHWSPGLDLKILLRTLPTVVGAGGAY